MISFGRDVRPGARRGRGLLASGLGVAVPCLMAAMVVSPVVPAARAAHVGLVLPRNLIAGGPGETAAAQVYDETGSPVPDGTVVTFLATLGVRCQPSQASTQNGWAVASLVPGTEAGFARVDAMVGTAGSDSVVWVRPAPARFVLWLRADPERLVTGATAIVTARLTDAFGNLAEGDEVTWDAAGGTVDPARGTAERGQALAVFTGGPIPGVGWVSLRAGDASGRAGVTVEAEPGRGAPLTRLYLPFVTTVTAGPRACEDVLANGSFEDDSGGADGPPDGWAIEATGGAVAGAVGDGIDGDRALRFLLPGGSSRAAARQALFVAPGARSADLRLWVRGGPGATLGVAVWTMVELPSGAVRAPVLVSRVPVDSRGWTPVDSVLPLAPLGVTTVEVGAEADGADSATVGIDDVRLAVCR